MTTAESLDRISADVISATRCQKSDHLSARVRLRFRLTDQHNSTVGEMVVCIGPIETESYRWRRTKRRIVDCAWEWLDGYFAGASFGLEGESLFADLLDDTHGLSSCGLTPEEEQSLQRELRQIEREFAA